MGGPKDCCPLESLGKLDDDLAEQEGEDIEWIQTTQLLSDRFGPSDDTGQKRGLWHGPTGPSQEPEKHPRSHEGADKAGG